MLATIPRSRLARVGTVVMVVAFFIYLFAPLVVVAVFAFNDSVAPSPPWRGFTFDWFVGARAGRTGLLNDGPLLRSLGVSLQVALWVTALSVAVGTAAAFLFERFRFPGRSALYIVMLWPLVIPGVILGISILLMSSTAANALEDALNRDLDFLRPGLPLVILGQFSFITTITTLVISARLRKFDTSLEEAALNLGATHIQAIRTITLPYLAPSMIGAAIVAFLMSFENFNTTLMLVGSDAPLTVAMYGRLREGTTPVINAVSLVLILASALLAAGALIASRKGQA
jgi:spermidine/putrescine transport system permease protein